MPAFFHYVPPSLRFVSRCNGSAISTGAINMAMMLVGRGIAGVGAAGLSTVRIDLEYFSLKLEAFTDRQNDSLRLKIAR